MTQEGSEGEQHSLVSWDGHTWSHEGAAQSGLHCPTVLDWSRRYQVDKIFPNRQVWNAVKY
jgi:hypothetical protein